MAAWTIPPSPRPREPLFGLVLTGWFAFGVAVARLAATGSLR